MDKFSSLLALKKNQRKNSAETIKEFNTVLLNTVILRRLFKFLNFKDLQDCRLVCRTWKQVIQPQFVKGLRVTFDFDKERMSDKLDMKKIINIFVEQGIQINSFRLQGTINVKVLEGFLSSFQSIILELYLDGVKLLNTELSLIKSYDLGQKLFEYNLKLTKLHVDCSSSSSKDNYRRTRMVLLMEKLISVKFLYFRDCTIIVDGKEKISPVELSLKWNKFIRSGQTVSQITVNDFVDFSEIRKLILWGSLIDSVWHYSDDKCNLALRMNDPVTVNFVELRRIKIQDWGTANWNVDRFLLFYTPFVQENRLTIKDLEIYSDLNPKQ